MICALFTPIDVKVFVEINNLVVNSKGASDENVSVAALPTADFSNMKAGEKLLLCGHGNASKVGGGQTYYGPDVLAALLLKNGLQAHIKSIKLVTCNSGSGGQQAYCVRLRQQIKQQSADKVDVPVIGITDLQTTNESGQVRAVDQGAENALSGYKKITEHWGEQLKVWEAHAAKLPCSTGEEITAGASNIASMSKGMFNELYAHNAGTSKSKQDSKLRA